ncbi:DNA gyrase inhibitor YacG [Planctomicrobium piriforme]|uniref:DNA gyrase inhibitor YacG n=1 Tax=Planctomicrobium piriforme TaxID=1576369 RepID=A0A1I3C318_9PLAN|nr:DNA gyrase inhibitor YacG [Planctomicrobium piriforme]SFH69008.1 hypothetical protein SAMN05421753_10277 [Planctomicrobium piriforme]
MIRRLTCPICNRELPPEIDGNASVFPFCSARCKEVDLFRWFSGDYAVVENLTPDQLYGLLPEDELPPELRG